MRLRWFWVLLPVVLGTVLALILFLTDFDNSLLYVQADLGSILFGLGVIASILTAIVIIVLEQIDLYREERFGLLIFSYSGLVHGLNQNFESSIRQFQGPHNHAGHADIIDVFGFRLIGSGVFLGRQHQHLVLGQGFVYCGD